MGGAETYFLFIQGMVPVSVLGSEDSKVHKTLTEMQRKGDKFHSRGINRPSSGLEGRKTSWRK